MEEKKKEEEEEEEAFLLFLPVMDYFYEKQITWIAEIMGYVTRYFFAF